MNNDLNEIYERLQICQVDFATLSDDIDKFVREAVVFHHEHSYLGTELWCETLQHKVPVILKSTAGRLVNEIRSCLDSLACTLAIRAEATRINDVYFPISKTKAIFETDGRRRMRRLMPEHQAIIADEIRPYWPENKILFALRETDNQRKHVKLGAWGAATTTSIGYGSIHKVILNPKVTEIPVKFAKSDVKLLASSHFSTSPLQGTADLYFKEPKIVANNPVKVTISEFLKTTKSIVDLFA